MKLYTEQELRKHLYNHSDEFFEELTPIELPSDEEIYKNSFKIDSIYWHDGFLEGAKWMKEQIIGEEDKTFKQKSKWTEVDNATRRLK